MTLTVSSEVCHKTYPVIKSEEKTREREGETASGVQVIGKLLVLVEECKYLGSETDGWGRCARKTEINEDCMAVKTHARNRMGRNLFDGYIFDACRMLFLL